MVQHRETLTDRGWKLGRREFLGVGLAGCLTSVVAKGASAPGKTRRRITVVLTGGGSHLDVWDLKPQAPREIRGPFRPISTDVPGMEISEHLPRLSRLAHTWTMFRGMTEAGPEIHDLRGYQPLIEGSVELFPGPSSPMFGRENPFAFDEFSKAERERYGEHAFGRNVLLARHLSERSDVDVTIHFAAGLLNTLSWDMHADGGDLAVNFQDVAWKLMPQLDQGLSALLMDLEQTGLLAETVVSVVSEMGRTPQINRRGGRDHFKGAWTNLAAGGPFVGGGCIGETDSLGGSVIAGGCSPQEFCRRVLSA